MKDLVENVSLWSYQESAAVIIDCFDKGFLKNALKWIQNPIYFLKSEVSTEHLYTLLIYLLEGSARFLWNNLEIDKT